MCHMRRENVPARNITQSRATPNPLARLTHRRELASARARNTFRKKMITTPFCRVTRRRKLGHNRFKDQTWLRTTMSHHWWLLARRSVGVDIPSAMAAPPMNPTLPRATPIARFNPVSDTSTRPARALTREFATCSGLKRPFARFNVRTRPRGFPVPRSYRPCPGLLPRIPKPVVTASRCWSFRAHWSRNAWHLRPRVRTRRNRLRAPLMVLVASICSAPIGYYFWTGDWSPPSQPVPGPKMTSLGPQTSAQSSVRPQDLPVARDDDRGTLVQGEVFS